MNYAAGPCLSAASVCEWNAKSAAIACKLLISVNTMFANAYQQLVLQMECYVGQCLSTASSCEQDK
jgi:hypothetical protein